MSQRVEVLGETDRGGGTAYFRGRIDKTNGDGTYKVRFDNDQTKDRVDEAFIREDPDPHKMDADLESEPVDDQDEVLEN